ncbi:hypothetical protein SDC9_124009 [bioreactor metagenome]|uniref:Uncharacterized protein n=1 Tax=bioreactor metagenome TaxID=1076179 RepID=A0A645CJ82_9ZZZZ
MEHHQSIFIICIRDSDCFGIQFVEEPFFHFQVFIEGFMVIQMIVGNIGETCDFEMQPFNSVLVDSMRGNFHKGVFTTGFHRLA